MWDDKKFQVWLASTYSTYQSSRDAKALSLALDQLAAQWDFHYEPIWYYKNSVISGYGLYGDTKGTGSFQGQQAFEDLIFLHKAVKDMKAFLQTGGQTLVIIPFYYSTLSNKMILELYLAYLKSQPAHIFRYMNICLYNFESLPTAQLFVLNTLRQYSRSLLLDVNYRKINSDGIFKAHAYGCDVYGDTFTENQLFKLLEDFVSHYDAGGHKTFITGVKTKSLLSAAVAAGFTYISGTAVSPVVDKLSPVEFMKSADIYLPENHVSRTR
ncbi:MAG: hypothetical protein AB7E85_06380 [Pseudobdellovibrionaceae bacterium]